MTVAQDPELAQAAAELLGESATCELCDPPRTFNGPNAERNLKLHTSNKHGAGAAAAASRVRPPAGPPKGGKAKGPASDAAIEAVVAEAVGYVTIGAGFLSYMLPHTGIAIAGVPDGSGGWIVASRAVIAGTILAGHAKTNPQILVILERFNDFCRGSEAATLAASLGTALAVDLQVIQPDSELAFGPMKIGPKLIIGDVIEEVDRMRAEWVAEHPEEAAAMAAQAAANGHHQGATRGAAAATEVPGGVENT